ncbi:MAG: hypothetical protein KBD53_02450 [Candidatus Omnitrophica bacterium]|nr:hypothetical protein [Candidatus Omnitrophota bacterium]
MSNAPYNLVLIGVKQVGLRALQTLLEDKAQVAAVLTTDSEQNQDLIQLAKKNKIDVLFDENISVLKEKKVQRGLMFSYSKRLSQNLINVFSQGIYNFHPAKLPEYRGCLPTVWPILNGDQEAFCSVHEVVKDFDAGGVVLQRGIPINADDTGFSLYERMVDCEINLLKEYITDFTGEQLNAKVQDESKAKYFKNKMPNNGEIDWTKKTQYVERFIRAVYHPSFRSAWTSLNNQVVEIIDAEIISDLHSKPQPGKAFIQNGVLIFGCANGFIRAKEIRLNGVSIKNNIVTNLQQNGAELARI